MQKTKTTLVRRCACTALLTSLMLSFVSVAGHGRDAALAAGGTAPVVGGSLAGVTVFPGDNPWNRDISMAPVDSNSANLVASIGLADALHPDFGTSYNGHPWGIPYVTVSGTQPRVPIAFTDWPAESDTGPYPIPLDAPVEGGPNGVGDRHVLVVDRDNQKLYELFNAFPTGTGWNASCGATFDLRSNAVRPEGWTSADAAGLPIFPGLVRYEEAAELREIRHALRFTANRTRRAYVYPARHFASSLTDPNLPPMGTRVRLKASFNVAAYPPTAQVILRALQRYGMILADNGGDWFLSGAPDPRWNDAEIETLKQVRGQDFEVIQLGYPGPPSAAVPVAPTGLQATAGNARVDLRWSPSSDAATYKVKRSSVSGGAFATLASGVTTSSFADTSVVNGGVYHYVVSAVSSAGESPNSSSVSASPSAGSVPRTTYRINCGGGDYGSPSSGVWSSERFGTGGAASVYGYRDLANTTDEPLYLRVRFGQSFQYDLPADPGVYTLRLHFAECWFTNTGMRRFNVSVNNVPALTGFDVVAAAGGPNRVVTREIPVTVSGGTATVVFQSVLNDAMISAMELIPASGEEASLPPPAPGNLRASPGNGRVDLQWSASTGAASYTLRRSTANSGSFVTLVTNLNGLTYADVQVSNGVTYYYQVSAVGPGGESLPSATASATPQAPNPLAPAIRINCGGLSVTDQTGQVWSADRYANGGAAFTYTPRDIGGTGEDYRYYTVRYSSGTDFAYQLPVPAGDYTLKLHFAECWFTTPGSRIFNVQVNGAVILNAFDVVAAGGANSAIVRAFPVTATGPTGVTLTFQNVKNGPIISAIELIPAG